MSRASVLIQYIYQDLEFRSPFLLTYIANSLLALYLPLWQLWVLLGIVPRSRLYPEQAADKAVTTDSKEPAHTISGVSGTEPTRNATNINEGDRNEHSEEVRRIDGTLEKCLLDQSSTPLAEPNHEKSIGRQKQRQQQQQQQITHYDILKMGAIVCPFWFLSNVLYNYSLYMTSVSSSTIISNLAASFTLAFSYWFGLEEVTKGKVMGILICFIGAICVALKDSNTIDEGDGDGGSDDAPEHNFIGDIIALTSAMGYGIYTTLIRYLVRLPSVPHIIEPLVCTVRIQ